MKNTNNKNLNKKPKIQTLDINKKKITDIKNKVQERDYIYDTTNLYYKKSNKCSGKKSINKISKIRNDAYDKYPMDNKPAYLNITSNDSMLKENHDLSKSFNQSSKKQIKPYKYAQKGEYNFIPTNAENNNNFENENDYSRSNNFINSNTNYSNNISYFNGNNLSSENIKINILKNLDEKFKNNSALKIRNSSNKKALNLRDRNYSNFSNLLNVSTSSNNILKNFNNTTNVNLNISNYSRAKSIASKDIKRFNSFVNIDDAFFRFKNEKSLEKKNKKLTDKENENVFNTTLNGILYLITLFLVSRYQKLVEDLKENTINDILLVIEKTKNMKENLELSLETKIKGLNELKFELNKTKKLNLSFNVDNQNMEMIQNVYKNYLHQ